MAKGKQSNPAGGNKGNTGGSSAPATSSTAAPNTASVSSGSPSTPNATPNPSTTTTPSTTNSSHGIASKAASLGGKVVKVGATITIPALIGVMASHPILSTYLGTVGLNKLTSLPGDAMDALLYGEYDVETEKRADGKEYIVIVPLRKGEHRNEPYFKEDGKKISISTEITKEKWYDGAKDKLSSSLKEVCGKLAETEQVREKGLWGCIWDGDVSGASQLAYEKLGNNKFMVGTVGLVATIAGGALSWLPSEITGTIKKVGMALIGAAFMGKESLTREDGIKQIEKITNQSDTTAVTPAEDNSKNIANLDLSKMPKQETRTSTFADNSQVVPSSVVSTNGLNIKSQQLS